MALYSLRPFVPMKNDHSCFSFLLSLGVVITSKLLCFGANSNVFFVCVELLNGQEGNHIALQFLSVQGEKGAEIHLSLLWWFCLITPSSGHHCLGTRLSPVIYLHNLSPYCLRRLSTVRTVAGGEYLLHAPIAGRIPPIFPRLVFFRSSFGWYSDESWCTPWLGSCRKVVA